MCSHFGASVAITDTGILVGAPGDGGPNGEDNYGSVYYFEGLVPSKPACFESGDLSEWDSYQP